MMTRPELIRALRRMKAETGSLVCLGCGYEHNCDIKGCAIIRAAAEELERIEAQPVRRGRWVKYESGGGFWYECSVCKGDALLKGWGQLDVYLSPYCPHCSADLREEAAP